MIIFSMERNWKGGGAFPVQGCVRGLFSWLLLSAVFPMLFFCFVLLRPRG